MVNWKALYMLGYDRILSVKLLLYVGALWLPKIDLVDSLSLPDRTLGTRLLINL